MKQLLIELELSEQQNVFGGCEVKWVYINDKWIMIKKELSSNSFSSNT